MELRTIFSLVRKKKTVVLGKQSRPGRGHRLHFLRREKVVKESQERVTRRDPERQH